MAAAAVLSVCAAAVVAVGCGGGNGESGETAPQKITLKAPDKPTDADCGLTGEGSAKDAERPPTPGAYSYALDGERALIGEKRRVTKLPDEMTTIVTDALSAGVQNCFRMQRRFEEDLGETGVFVTNGGDLLLRSGRFQAGGDITDLLPDPPITLVSGSEMEWSGSFTGVTTGRYEAEVVERKVLRVGGERVRVVGIKSNVTYAGEIEGFERATRWLAIDETIVVAEEVVQERAYGLDRMRLSYKSRLKSLDAR